VNAALWSRRSGDAFSVSIARVNAALDASPRRGEGAVSSSSS